jgi:hypothetical protein
MRKSLQNGKVRRVKARFVGRLILRLVLAAVIGVFTGKLFLSGVHQYHQAVGSAMQKQATKPVRSSERLETKSGQTADTAGKDPIDSDLPSPGSRAYLSLIGRFPTLNSRDFFKLVQQSAGGAPLRDAVLNEWAKRFPKEMFQAIHAGFPSEDDPRSKWSGLAVIQWMKLNPDEAIAALDRIPRKIGSGGSDPHQTAIGAAKDSGDFGLALDLESRWPDQVWSGARDAEFDAWYANQPALALAKIAKIGHAGLRGSYIERIGILAAAGSEDSILASASSFSALDRQAFLKGVAGAMAKDSPEAAVSFLTRNFEGPVLIEAAELAILEWSSKDPRAAIQWSEENLHGKSRDKVMAGAIRQVAGQDQELATDLVMEMNPGSARNESAAVLLKVRGGEEASQLAEWIESFPDAAAKRFMLDKNWSRIVRGAPELLQILTTSEDPRIASERRIAEVAKSLNANEPQAFESWLRSLPERNRNIAETAVK